MYESYPSQLEKNGKYGNVMNVNGFATPFVKSPDFHHDASNVIRELESRIMEDATWEFLVTLLKVAGVYPYTVCNLKAHPETVSL